ncbi:MAG: 16S rRNA (cytosine(1402)-N(4))-methyltransferase RsmH [Anaerolineaceae bacterium]|nr:16S rRNA (cytosine(1402)-N(4))-methyltransferase RsmH [Anaerolineaceae bacterium]
MNLQQIPHHQPVLYHEILAALNPVTNGRYVDCTLGAGGHTFGIIEASSPNRQLLGFVLDSSPTQLSKERLKPFGDRAFLRRRSYHELESSLLELEWGGVDGIVMDFGVSSMQFDRPERGFSFREDGPLDMRFNPQTGQSAAELLNTLSKESIANILWKYGEEQQSRRIAAAICQQRPLSTTTELAELIVNTVRTRSRHGRKTIHPATKTFQALRIAVNHELDAVENVLPMAVRSLNPGGRLAVISFHSLEDRIVKQFFQKESRDCICPPEQPICTCNHKASISRITRKPITANPTELKENRRARSAKLRIVEKKNL